MAHVIFPTRLPKQQSTDSLPEPASEDVLSVADFRYRWNNDVRKPHMKAENFLLGKVGRAQHTPRLLPSVEENSKRVPTPRVFVRDYVMPSMLVQQQLLHTGQNAATIDATLKERVRKRKIELRAGIDLVELEIEAREALYEMRSSELVRCNTQLASMGRRAAALAGTPRADDAQAQFAELTDRRDVLATETRELALAINELNKRPLTLTQEMENDSELKQMRAARAFERRQLIESRVKASEQIMQARLGAAELTELIVVTYLAEDQRKIAEQAATVGQQKKKTTKNDDDESSSSSKEEEEETQLVRRSRAEPGFGDRVSPTEFRMLWNTQVRERALRIAKLAKDKTLVTLAGGIVEFGRPGETQSVPKTQQLQTTYWQALKRFQESAFTDVFGDAFRESEFEACLELMRQSRRAFLEKIQLVRRQIAALQRELDSSHTTQQDAARGFSDLRRRALAAGNRATDETAAQHFRELVLEHEREQQVKQAAIGRLSRSITTSAREQSQLERRILEKCERAEREQREQFRQVLVELNQLTAAVSNVVNAVTYSEIGAAEQEEPSAESDVEQETEESEEESQ